VEIKIGLPTVRWAVSFLAFRAGWLIVLACGPAVALDPNRTISQFHHTAWTAKEGAPSQISALVQTSDGYLWIGSARGLFRFDGVRFERYQPPEGISLPSQNIYALLATQDGGLWISFRPSGLGFLKDGRITVYTRKEELPPTTPDGSPHIYTFAQDQDGRVWVGTHDGLMLRENDRWTPIGRDWDFNPRRIRDLFVDHSGGLWVATDDLFYLPRGSHKFQKAASGLNMALGIAQAKDDAIWLAVSKPIDPIEFASTHARVSKSTSAIAVAIAFDREGNLWQATLSDGLKRSRIAGMRGGNQTYAAGKASQSFTEADGLTGDSVTTLLEDREGNIWAGTRTGLDRFRRSNLVPVKMPPGHQNFTLLPGPNGEIFAGSATDRPVLRVRDNVIMPETFGQSSASVYRNESGAVWWGGENGIWRQTVNRVEHFDVPSWLKRDWIWEVFRGEGDGGVWINYGDEGLKYVDKHGVWSNRAKPKGLPARGPSASFNDPQGRTWLGYTEDRVSLLDHGKVRNFSKADGIVVGRVRVIRGRGGHLWVGGELGLAFLRQDRFHSVIASDGAPFGTVTGIIETKDGALWLNEVQGIVHIAPEEIQKVLVDPGYRVRFQRFDYLDGMRGAPQMNWTVSTGVEGGNGKLWFATDNGLVWVDPLHIVRNILPPPVMITSITADDHAYAVAPLLGLAKGTSKLRIDYTALSLSVPERVHFRFRLEGFDKDWQDAGTRRQAFYTNLGPGKYRFHVIASNEDGVWNEEGASMELVLPPTFFQTKWFIALCVLMLSAIVSMLYMLRSRQLALRIRSRLEGRLAERERIARDLHDTLLQGIQGLILRFQSVSQRIPPSEPARQLMEKALERADEMMVEGRDRVRGLRATTQVANDLPEALAQAGEEFAQDNSTHFALMVQGTAQPLHPIVGEETYRIGREAIANAFGHAYAGKVEVEISYTRWQLRLSIRDNGRGIDEAILAAGGRPGHWGLSGMHERAQKFGAKLEIWSRLGTGAEVRLTVPSATAYRRRPLFARLWRRALYLLKRK